jgi:hypothetical protein
MNRREKILAAAVGSLLLLMVIGYGVGQVSKTISRKRNEVARLQEEKWQKELAIKNSKLDEELMEAYKNSAMPPDLEQARTLYKAWLMDCAKDVGFDDWQVNPTAARSSSDVYKTFAFTVSGQADLKQVIEFLHRFYSVDYLHRVYHLHAKRIQDSKQHELTISVEALSLPTATNTDQLPEGMSDQLSHGELVAYLDTILSRNLSRRPNNAPTMDSIGKKTVYTGRPVEITVSGEDPDKLDNLTYAIDGDGLSGARIDEKTGRFEWTPEEPGNYQVAVLVKDDRWGSEPARQVIEFDVTDAPPEEVKPEDLPSFELAKFAYVTAITEVSGRRQTWINLRTEGKVLKLHEGDSFGIGEVEVTVKRIAERAVELEAKILKKRLSVSLGDNVSEGNELPTAETSLQ